MFNLGNTQPHTVSEMVDLLETHLGRKAVREHIPMPPTGDVLATFADITAARKVRPKDISEPSCPPFAAGSLKLGMVSTQ